jgi:hypothetical protein
MNQSRRRLRFTLEASAAFMTGGQQRGQRLDRDIALQSRVVRSIDLSHPAGADHRADLVRAESDSTLHRHTTPLSSTRIPVVPRLSRPTLCPRRTLGDERAEATD